MRTRVTDLFGIEVPIIQAPMAGASGTALAIEVAAAGGLGSLPCAMLSGEVIREQVAAFRSNTDAPLNLNFFCHATPAATPEQLQQWDQTVSSYYKELGLEQPAGPPPGRAPFDEAMCSVVEELRPEVVSFHFGLPQHSLLDRVLASGAKVLSSATTVEEAVWLEENGCAAVIAQGAEAGGHRGMFLTSDISTQIGTMALVPLVADAVETPVIAAGGISDARGISAALILGADGVQLGTAYLLCPEAMTGPLHRQALLQGTARSTALTNVLTGRPARSIVNRIIADLGPMAPKAPPFPLAANAVGPLRAAAEAQGSTDFTPLWSGQAGPLAVAKPARELTQTLMNEAQALLSAWSART
jgi:nitronate monooxygenase